MTIDDQEAESENAQIRDSFAFYGRAMYYAQVLEHGLVNAMLIANVASGASFSPREAGEFMDRRFQQTLGRLIRELQRHVEVPPDLSGLLKLALEKRNRLAHGFFREHAEEALTHRGRQVMIDELAAITELFRVADGRLDEAIAPLRERTPFTEERIQAAYREPLSQAEQRD